MTLVYSRWKPDTGGYEYLEVEGSQNINDDLPPPELPLATKIGVPSIEAGRAVPAGARVVGEGELAVGIIAPVDESRIVRRTRSLGGLETMSSSAMLWAMAGVAGVALTCYVYKKR